MSLKEKRAKLLKQREKNETLGDIPDVINTEIDDTASKRLAGNRSGFSEGLKIDNPTINLANISMPKSPLHQKTGSSNDSKLNIPKHILPR